MENFPFVEVEEIGNSREAILNLLKSQKALFHSQINEFRRVVRHQCKLTGSDLIFQDIIASSLNHKRGKTSKASLNPKAVKYLYSVFSIKDTTSKKETHEISTLCGTTVTQVREFFKTERSKVKKLVRRSKNLLSTKKRKVSKINVSVDFGEKEFIDKILSMMGKEETFSGQVKLMEWVLRIQNKAVLNWFSTKGGITILALWLNDAALEEQTTVISVILKVFCHIPFDKARRTQVSDVLQTVNKLRFYRNPEISKSAKDLLSSWSNMFLRRRKLENDRNHLIKVSALAQDAGDRRVPEPGNGQKLIISSSDTSEKHELSMSAERIEESGKVQVLVEHPDSKLGRNRPVAKASSSNQSRPLSADDINKVKMLTVYTQERDGNTPPDVRKPPLNNQTISIINAGQVQMVQESIYQTGHQILPNPKELEGSEINYNDALTPVIPTEEHADDTAANVKMPAAIDFTEVDLDLLQVLLNNPELVEALTSACQNLSQRECSVLLESVKKAGSTQAVPVPRPVSLSRPNWPIRNNQAQLASPPKILTYNSLITQNLDYGLQHQQPLPMQVMYNPNHSSFMPSNYYQANNPLTITRNNLSLSRPVSLPRPNLPVNSNQAQLASKPRSNNQANLAYHLTVPGYSRPEFIMYGRGRGYHQSNLNFGNRVREKRLPGPHFR